MLKTLEELRKEQAPKTAAATGYFDFMFRVKQPKSAAQVESLISEWVSRIGGVCTKVNIMGREITKTTESTFAGKPISIRKKSFIPSTTRKGTSDLIVGYKGRILYVEVKFSKSDRQSQHQRKFEQDVIKAGCDYIIVKDLKDFYLKFKKWS